MGEAELIFKGGLMNAGKTLRLAAEAHALRSTGKQIIIAKPAIDTKGDSTIESRLEIGGQRLRVPVDLLIHPEDDAREVLINTRRRLGLSGLQKVFIDEGQMLADRQVEQIDRFVVTERVPVAVFGLTTDFLRRTFPATERLLALCDRREIYESACMSDGCMGQGHTNVRKVNGDIVFDGPQIAVDGEGDVTYEVLCKQCYYTAEAKYFAEHGIDQHGL